MKRKLRYGMVGGSLDAFIGGVHRKAIALEETAELVAGCFSTNSEKNLKCGEFYNLSGDRIYSDYREMAEGEKNREDKIDFVSIVTPNSTHFEISKAFLEADIHVMCEKPLCFTVEEAKELSELAKDRNLFFGVMYTYSGYPMVKLAKQLVEDGEIGHILNVNAEYLQDWLIDQVGEDENTDTNLSIWRTDPKVSGISNCVGDIGTHIENTVAYITGLHPKKVLASLDYYGKELDLNANIIVEYENGVHGVYSSSQVCVGHLNGLVVRVFGTKGSIEWVQEDPNYLKVVRKGEPEQIYHRGTAYVGGRAAELNHIPAGHPEGLVFAIANHYRSFMGAICKKLEGSSISNKDLDFPSVLDGVEGVKFIHAAVGSSKEGNIWREL
ncbi:Gfo/Idh/MocA family protein [Anaerosphaera multitolerans]|uniref:Gfo/Idh/MocA family oxidoreductase n=1 Tax=Anaerosphaera multitolerans TaxID=2487351 RepID=A0A437S5U8_9FIRM|nr:Gfo/Idh/MocA family oxidoreductase [Anaerosphaera multitolerans]RVU54391.1 gfo/Idh/MocA family oxidoreductase [Anaerosphaera multitolerans]